MALPPAATLGDVGGNCCHGQMGKLSQKGTVFCRCILLISEIVLSHRNIISIFEQISKFFFLVVSSDYLAVF